MKWLLGLALVIGALVQPAQAQMEWGDPIPGKLTFEITITSYGAATVPPCEYVVKVFDVNGLTNDPVGTFDFPEFLGTTSQWTPYTGYGFHKHKFRGEADVNWNDHPFLTRAEYRAELWKWVDHDYNTSTPKVLQYYYDSQNNMRPAEVPDTYVDSADFCDWGEKNK